VRTWGAVGVAPPLFAGWERVAFGLFERVYREAAGHVADKRTSDLLDELKKYPE